MTKQEAWEYVIAKELDVQYLDMLHRVKVSNRSEGSSAFGFFEGIGDDIIDAVQDFRRMVMAERDRFQALMTDRIRGLEAIHSLPNPATASVKEETS